MDINHIFIVTFNFICYIGGQEELLCSHEALHVALLNPTVYSQITGNSYKYLSRAHDIHTFIQVVEFCYFNAHYKLHTYINTIGELHTIIM